MTTPSRAFIRRRAGFRCEYCHFPEAFAALRFQLDHVRAEQHGGTSAANHLAWSWMRCNKHKGPNLSSIDPRTGRTTRLFNPRKDVWAQAFRWVGSKLAGLSAVGRATVAALQCNHPDATLVREALMAEGVSFE